MIAFGDVSDSSTMKNFTLSDTLSADSAGCGVVGGEVAGFPASRLAADEAGCFGRGPGDDFSGGSPAIATEQLSSAASSPGGGLPSEGWLLWTDA